MYFWKTEQLAQAIKNESLTERDWKSYYLFVNLLLSILMYMVAIIPRSGGIGLLLIEGVLVTAITIFGINITFKTNEVLGGKNYIARVTALGCPIFIKIFMVSSIIGFIVGILSEMHIIDAVVVKLSVLIISVLTQVFFFWRINFHLKNINT